MKYMNKLTRQIGELTHPEYLTPIIVLADGTELILTRATIRNEWVCVDDSPVRMLEATFNKEMRKWNASHDENKAEKFGVIVYAQSNFGENYSEFERSYRVSNANGRYQSKMSDSLVGSCLDGIDLNVQLDYFDWIVEYCYFE